jgi:hypothetical protein
MGGGDRDRETVRGGEMGDRDRETVYIKVEDTPPPTCTRCKNCMTSLAAVMSLGMRTARDRWSFRKLLPKVPSSSRYMSSFTPSAVVKDAPPRKSYLHHKGHRATAM